MSIIKAEDEKKWINAFVAVASILIGYIFIRFFAQLGEWFDIESKIKYFTGVAQGVGVLIGLATFLVATRHKKAAPFMSEVFRELVKVVWPDKESVVKLTVGLIIALIIISMILMLIDYLSQGALNIIYDL